MRLAAAAALGFAIAASTATAAHASAAPSYADALRAVAARLEHAANARTAVPAVHAPPAPRGGPPRFSPSVDDWLQASLREAREAQRSSRAADLRAIAASLRHVAEDAEPSAPSGATRDEIEATAASVLAEPAYRVPPVKPQTPPPPSLLERILDWFARWIAALFGRLAAVTQDVPALGTIFAVILIVLGAAGLAFVGYRLAMLFALRRRPGATDFGQQLAPEAESDELFTRARAEALAGRPAHAVALAYQAALIALDRADRIAYDPARTTGEYRLLVRRRAQPVASFFETLAREFTAAAFAHAVIDNVDWDRAADAYASIGRALGAA